MTDTHVRDDEARQIRSESGFTLVELLIVIVILGILTAVVVFSVGGLRNSGNAAACRAQQRTAETAVEAYNARQGSYPGVGVLGTLASDTYPAANTALTNTQATNVLGHLVSDTVPAGAPAAHQIGIKLLKEAPKTANFLGTPAAPTTPTGLPAPAAGEATFSGSFVTMYLTKNTLGAASDQLTVHGYYMNGNTPVRCS
ncbi:MAG: type II secretion system protein [Acidimicrobiia bacterium]|nr:type II secretion system protein [Acidimicrobiia bacterium]